jgi:hypothetical protein
MAMSAMLWPGNYIYMFPLLVQARTALWTNFDRRRGGNVLDLAFPQEIRRCTDKNAMFIELVNGSTVQLLGSDNYNALVGGNYFGIVFSEWALSDPESWAYLRPILTENRTRCTTGVRTAQTRWPHSPPAMKTQALRLVRGAGNDILKAKNATSVKAMLNHVLEVTQHETPAQPAV